jgi:hypothetical protein
MRIVFLAILIFCCLLHRAQEISKSSLFYNLAKGDSIVVYQCHVEKASTTLQTASGQTITGTEQMSSITEKFVILKTDAGFELRYFTSDLNVLPNRKFSGLKIREKDYWHFTFVKQSVLSEDGIKALTTLETKGREAIEYDFAISRYTTNQIIFKKQKNFKQLVYDQAYLISNLLKLR